MSTTISSSTTSLANALFDKLDTKKKGYVDQTDLQSALGTDSTDTTTTEAFKEIDEDSDGKVSKSELSVALQKVGDELAAQMDQSRVNAATPSTADTGTTTTTDDSAATGTITAASSGAAPAGGPHGGGGGGGGGKAGSATSGSSTETTTKYVAAADTDNDGTVSDAEEAAYEKAQAALEIKNAEEKAAELKAQTQVQEYKTVQAASDTQEISKPAVDVSA